MWTEEEIYGEFHESWHPVVEVYMKKIKRALRQEGTIYPPKEYIFRVFKKPLEDIKVVILGQDPYHGYGQATGLCFDCSNQTKVQPSLRNMFDEIKREFPKRNYNFEGNSLVRWFDEENFFLLNSALTVLEGEPKSLLHLWYDFTDAIIQYIADYNQTCIFLLMGNPAKAKSAFIQNKSRIVSCAHPSPLSVRHFIGCNAFKKVESKLGYEINWSNV